MSPVISFIVPIYKVERFLAKCLNSIIDNNWQHMQYEIIVVDDASPDQSIAIAHVFAKKHQNITIISQENKGLGGARNIGMKEARGSYLFFLDSDDFLKPNVIQEMLKIALENNLDILEFGAERVDENYRFIDRVFQKRNSKIVDGQTYIAQYNFENSACNKLYRKNFLVENHITFFEKTYIEDAPFNAEAFSKAQRVKSVPNIPVVFYQNQLSITRQNRSGENLKKFIEDSIKVTSKMHTVAGDMIVKESQNALLKKVAFFTAGIILMIVKSKFSISDKEDYIAELRRLQLYPIKSNSGILIRNIFIKFSNNDGILKLILRFL